MKIAKKWNYSKHDYEPYNLPDGASAYPYDDMDYEISCACCGKRVKFGDTYTSFEIHTDIGMGYWVCESCHEIEYDRRRKQ